jgi:cytochrome c553
MFRQQELDVFGFAWLHPCSRNSQEERHMKHESNRARGHLRALGMLCGMLLVSAAVHADAIPPLEERLQLCGSCHNPDGNSIIPENPKIAGLHVKYLTRQLEDFKSGKRASPIMSTIIPMVDEKEFKALATYFSGQKRLSGTSDKPDLVEQGKQVYDKGFFGGKADLIAKGREVYEEGVLGSAVPACAGCHGEDGSGNDKFPRLNGQNPPYVLQQLRNFKNGVRTNDPKGVMRAVAKRLTDEEMSAVAEYIFILKEAE